MMDEGLKAAGERFLELAPREVDPSHEAAVLRNLVRVGLKKLRDLIADPAETRVSWTRPFLELRLPVPWDFDARQPGGILFARFGPEDLVEGRVPKETIEKAIRRAIFLRALHTLTNCVVELRPPEAEAASQFWIPQAFEPLLDEAGERGTEERCRLVDRLARPFTIGPYEAARDPERASAAASIPPIPFAFRGALEGAVVAICYPLVVDPAIRRAWFILGVGLTFAKGDPSLFPAEDLAAFWAELETPFEEPGPFPEELAGPDAGTPRTARLLRDSPVKIDAKAARVVSFFGNVRLWRTWDRVRSWDELVQEEVDRIRDTYGGDAFEEEPGTRGPLLTRRWTPDREERVELTQEAKADLLERAGPRGFRRVQRDPDGIRREYLVKRVRAGRGRLTLSFSWYGQAPLSPEARAAEERRLLAAEAREALELFPPSEEVAQARADALRLLGSMKDAWRIAPRLLTAFYQQATNPLRIPAWELSLALECETDPDHLNRVRGALEALRRLEYDYEGIDLGRELSGRVRGSFVLEFAQGPGHGAGDHKEDVAFFVTLSAWAIGCLRVFARTDSRVKHPEALFFDWGTRLEKSDRAGLDYLQGFSALASYYDTAAGLTPAQARLREWIEDNITRRKDATSPGRKALRASAKDPDAEEPRTYEADFCPLLEPGRRYHCAAGHYQTNAEAGRKLAGRPKPATRTGGPRAGGLLDVLGYELPPGRAWTARAGIVTSALKDLRAVVEEHLRGRVAGRRRGAWLSLQEAERVRPEELLEEVSWLLFIPEDWLAQRRKRFEEHHQRRYERGETDRPIRVIGPGQATAPVGLAACELRVRLHAARKERELSQTDVGRIFGVSQRIVAYWEIGPGRKGKPIPADLEPLILRWVETGEGPTAAELEALTARRQRGQAKI